MQVPHNSVILVADGRKSLFFRNQGDADFPNLSVVEKDGRKDAAHHEIASDLAGHASKSLDDIAGLEFDAVVTMGCSDDCPWVPAMRREDWALPDPREMDDAGYRAVRDEIDARVQALLASLS